MPIVILIVDVPLLGIIFYFLAHQSPEDLKINQHYHAHRQKWNIVLWLLFAMRLLDCIIYLQIFEFTTLANASILHIAINPTFYK